MEDLGDRQHEIGNFTLIYANHCDSVIERHVKEDEPQKISRAKIEMEILELVESSNFPLPYRLAMYCMVANTDVFELYWREKRSRFDLDEEATARLRPNYDLIFDIPPLYSPITTPDSGSTAGRDEADTHEAKLKLPRPITPSNPDFEWEVLNASVCDDPESSSSTSTSYSESVAESTPTPERPNVNEPTPAPPAVAQQSVPPPATETAGLTPAATPVPGAIGKEKETDTSEPPPAKKKRTYTKKRAAPSETEDNNFSDEPLMKRARRDSSKTPSRSQTPSVRGKTPSSRGKAAAGRGGKGKAAAKKALPSIQEEQEQLENDVPRHTETGGKSIPPPEVLKAPRSPTKKTRGTTTAGKGPRGGAAGRGSKRGGKKE